MIIMTDVIIPLTRSVSDPSKISSGNENSKVKKLSKRKLLHDKDLGLAIEAFVLSNQSIALYNNSILTPLPLSSEAEVVIISQETVKAEGIRVQILTTEFLTGALELI